MKQSFTLYAKQIKNNRIKNNLPVYDAGLGENPMPPPSELVETLQNYAHIKHYTNVEGIPQLKNILSKNIIIGNGLKPLIYITQLAFSITYPEGTIIHLAPQWLSYKAQTDIIKCSTITIPCEYNTWKINICNLDNILSKLNGPKMLLFNNPNNPSGCVYNNREVLQIAKICKKYNIIVLADQIYSKLTFPNIEITGIHKYYNKVIRGSSLSKTYACGGYRFGWLNFPLNLYELYTNTKSIASSIYSCPSAVFQHVAITALNHNNNNIKYYIEFQKNMYHQISLIIKEKLINMNLKFSDSQAAWYILIDFENYSDALIKNHITSSNELCEQLINDIGLITVSGTAFNINKKFVLRYSAVDINIHYKNLTYELKNILEGLDKLSYWLQKLIN